MILAKLFEFASETPAAASDRLNGVACLVVVSSDAPGQCRELTGRACHLEVVWVCWIKRWDHPVRESMEVPWATYPFSSKSYAKRAASPARTIHMGSGLCNT